MFTFLFFLVFCLNGALASMSQYQGGSDFIHSVIKSRTNCIKQDRFLYLCGSETHHLLFNQMIEDIKKTSVGLKTWDVIKNSGHQLVLIHDPESLSSAGREYAELTRALSNGKGASVVIHFHTEIPDKGSHRVGGTKEEWTEFSKRQNFYHELSHAKHKMAGTWNPIKTEEQAIEEENYFRIEDNPSNLNLRSFDWYKGEQIWFP